jgi:hypothetical protein
MTTLRASRRRITWTLSLISLTFVVLHIAAQLATRSLHLGWTLTEVLSRFDLDQEIAIPTWFSQVILLMSAALLAVIAAIRRRDRQWDRRYWAGLAVIFLYLSVDEGSSLHEIAVLPVRKVLHIHNSFLVLSWIIPAGILVLLFALVYLRFWWRLPADVRWRVAVAGVIYVGGALIMEACSSAYVARFGYEGFGLVLVRILEEGMEMIGICIFNDALLRYIGQLTPSIRFDLEESR